MVSYVPPHQRGYQNNNQNTQSQQHGNQRPHENIHQGQGSMSNQPLGVNSSQPNFKLPWHIDDVLGDLLNSQQHIQGNMQANNNMIATTLNEIRGHDGRIPATVKMLDRANISKITLRSELEELVEAVKKHERDDPDEGTSNAVKRLKPYLYKGEPKRQKEDPTDFMEIFGKLEINLPFLQALKLPPFSRFIKDFIAEKAKADGKIVIGESVSAVIQKKRLPSKRTNPGMFTLPIIIGDVKIEHAICDLGASINVLPFSVYKRLTGVSLVDTKEQLAAAELNDSIEEEVSGWCETLLT
ncbi:uncharacterized protein LOC121796770 [Salvia splendens]|uniref:uncharacterized protein LOC121796770 n=1 Tax=Salvia splendens TaxID=180675 RepID=UPI001C25EC1A|nr:uncharacterized protein LOC121796770 [Salvia splendens]